MVIEQVYANALFEAAKENNELEKTFSQVSFFVADIFNGYEFESFMLNPDVTFIDKKNLLEKIFDEGDLLLNFFLVLLVKNRFKYACKIFDNFISQYWEYKNVLHAKIFSVCKLPDEIIESVRKILEKKFGASIIIDNVIDDSIIGGFVVKVNKIVVDLSIKLSLDNFKKYLIGLRLDEWSGLST